MIKEPKPYAEYKESDKCIPLRKSAQSVDQKEGYPQISQINADFRKEVGNDN
jgi:hypothetical protein